MIAAPDELAEAVRRLAAGTGPVAVDAERDSATGYGQRAYLVQLRREGAGTMLDRPDRLPGPQRRRRHAHRRRGGAARRAAGPALPGRSKAA